MFLKVIASCCNVFYNMLICSDNHLCDSQEFLKQREGTDSGPQSVSSGVEGIVLLHWVLCLSPGLGVLGEGAQAAGVHVSSYVDVDGRVGFGEFGWCRDSSGARRRQRDQLLTQRTAAAATAILGHKHTQKW